MDNGIPSVPKPVIVAKPAGPDLSALSPLIGMLGGFLPGIDQIAAAAGDAVARAEERIERVVCSIEQIAADVAAIRKKVCE